MISCDVAINMWEVDEAAVFGNSLQKYKIISLPASIASVVLLEVNRFLFPLLPFWFARLSYRVCYGGVDCTLLKSLAAAGIMC